MANDIRIDVGARNLASRVFAKVGDDAGRMTQRVNRMGSSSIGVFRGMSAAATSATGSFLALAGAGAAMSAAFASVRTFANFDAEMSKVEAISGATGQNLDALRDKAKELGSSTQFSASQAAEGMKFLGQAGFDTNEILAGIGPTLSLAAAGALELGMAADIASDVSSAFGLTADEIGRVADVLAVTATSANTNVEMMGETFKLSAPLAKAAGQSLEEMSAAAGLLGNSGVKATVAGTDLKNILTALADTKAETAFQRVGISVRDTSGNIRPMLDLLREFGERTANMPGADRLRLFADLFGRSAKSAIILGDAGGEAIDELRSKMENADGAAEKMAETMQNNLGGGFTKVGSALEGLQIAIVSKFEKPLEEATEGAAKHLQELTESIESGNTSLDELGETASSVADGVGPLVELFGNAIGTVDVLAEVIADQLNPSLGGMGELVQRNIDVFDVFEGSLASLGISLTEFFSGDRLAPTIGGQLDQATLMAQTIVDGADRRLKIEQQVTDELDKQIDKAEELKDAQENKPESTSKPPRRLPTARDEFREVFGEIAPLPRREYDSERREIDRIREEQFDFFDEMSAALERGNRDEDKPRIRPFDNTPAQELVARESRLLTRGPGLKLQERVAKNTQEMVVLMRRLADDRDRPEPRPVIPVERLNA